MLFSGVNPVIQGLGLLWMCVRGCGCCALRQNLKTRVSLARTLLNPKACLSPTEP